MRYLKKSAELLIGKAGSQNKINLRNGYDLSDHTTVLAMSTYRCDGNEEEFLSICATREQLEQIKSAINNYLLKPEIESSKQVNKTDNKDSTPFKLNPIRVMSMKVGAEKWEARTRIFNGISDGLVDLIATADSEEAAREELDKKFENFAKPMTNFIKFMSQAS